MTKEECHPSSLRHIPSVIPIIRLQFFRGPTVSWTDSRDRMQSFPSIFIPFGLLHSPALVIRSLSIQMEKSDLEHQIQPEEHISGNWCYLLKEVPYEGQ